MRTLMVSVAVAGSLAAVLTGAPRTCVAMARDGLLPQSFSRIHPRYRTPHVTTIWFGVVVGLSI